jgi:hypothetical protein
VDVWLPLAAVALPAILGLRPRALLRSPAALTAAALLGEVIVVFIVTPLPLQWHLASAMDRGRDPS